MGPSTFGGNTAGALLGTSTFELELVVPMARARKLDLLVNDREAMYRELFE